MPVAAILRWMSPEEYLTGERESASKRDYVNGHVFPLAPADLRHAAIHQNLLDFLLPAATTQGGAVHGGDVKLRVQAANAFYYPDVIFTSEKGGDGQVIYAPKLVAEIASPDTAAVDRREKLAAYLTIPWLTEYLIVDQNRRQVDVWRRTVDGWRGETYVNGELPLESVGLTLTIDQLFG